MLRTISHQLENLNGGISDLQVKISNAETRISSLSEAQTSLINKMAEKPVTIDENPFATANAIQVRIDDNVRMLAELHARWEREDEIARNNKMTKVCTITTTSNTEVPSASILISHKYRGSCVAFSISKSVEPNEELKVG